ncbi:MAG: alpha/beta hydrolase [Deltaproteobacteria bacterium]|nr:MAG: alpha/beta hydrolase [Deltaproteobacteria bacterium]
MKRRAARLPWGVVSFLEGGGEGVPVVFVHGAGSQGSVWERVVPLPGKRRFILVDLPGHGFSSFRPCPSIEEYRECLLKFFDEISLERPVLVGHSMGGAIAIKTAAVSDLSALILVGTGGKLGVNPKLLKALREDFPGAVRTMARWSVLKGSPEELLLAGEEDLFRAGQTVLLQDMENCDSYSGEEDLSRIFCPTLVVCGREDVMTPLPLSEHLAERIPGARLEVIGECGHTVQWEKPDELKQAISSFLDETGL